MEPPLATSILLCDHIIVEAGTNKKSLIGCFTGIGSSAFPYLLDQFTIFILLSGAIGKLECKVQVKHLNNEKDGEIMVELTGTADFRNPNEPIELAFEFKKFLFKQPGTYSVSFLCDDSLIAERRFSVYNPTQMKGK